MSHRIIRSALTALMLAFCLHPISTAFATPNVSAQESLQDTSASAPTPLTNEEGSEGEQSVPSTGDDDLVPPAVLEEQDDGTEQDDDTEEFFLEDDSSDSEASGDTDSEVSDDLVSTDEIQAQSASLARYDTPLAQGSYIIRPAMSDGKVLDIYAASTAPCANLQLYSSNMAHNQRFTVSFDDVTGLYTLQVAHSGQVLDVEGNVARSGANVCQYPSKDSAANQQWIIVENHNRPGTYRIISALSQRVASSTEDETGSEDSPSSPPTFSPELVLDVSYGHDQNEANISIYQANGASWQSFIFIPETPYVAPSTANIADGYYTITSQLAGNMRLDINGASEENNAALQLWSANTSLAQVFYIKREGDYYSVCSQASGKALDVPKSNMVAGIRIIQYDNNNADNQRWALHQNEDGSYTFVSKKTGYALDVWQGNSQAGTPITQWYKNPNSPPNQCFSLSSVDDVVIEASYITVTPFNQRNKALDVKQALTASGTPILAYNQNGGLNQKFSVETPDALSPNTYAFRSCISGCYLSVQNRQVIQEKRTEGSTLTDNQQWIIHRELGGYVFVNKGTGEFLSLAADGSGGHIITTVPSKDDTLELFRITETLLTQPNGHYVINNAFDLCLDINGAYTAAGTNIQVYIPNDTSAQKFRFEHIESGYFAIWDASKQRVLDIHGASVTNGANVHLWDYNGGANQLWRLVPTGDGWFYLQSKSGMYLTSDTGDFSLCNVDVQQSIVGTGETQRFRFESTVYIPPVPYQGTFIDVNISTQRLMFVRDGWPILECDIVTGAPWMSTPTGTYRILYKTGATVLRGPGYASPVSFWMPFTTRGHGFHDASWRYGIFGGSIWRTNGSHGCVNMPYWAAQELHYWINPGDEVRIHY